MENKEKILHCALQLFSSRGYDAVGVQEICEKSGITKPTLYYYFESKRGLLDAIIIEYYPPFLEEIKHRAEYRRDLIMNLEGLAFTFFRFAVSRPDFNRLFLSIMFSPRESEAYLAHRKYTMQLFQCIGELFKVSVPENGNLRGKEKQLTASFIGLLHSYTGLYLNNSTRLDDAVARALVKQFMYGIYS